MYVQPAAQQGTYVQGVPMVVQQPVLYGQPAGAQPIVYVQMPAGQPGYAPQAASAGAGVAPQVQYQAAVGAVPAQPGYAQPGVPNRPDPNDKGPVGLRTFCGCTIRNWTVVASSCCWIFGLILLAIGAALLNITNTLNAEMGDKVTGMTATVYSVRAVPFLYTPAMFPTKDQCAGKTSSSDPATTLYECVADISYQLPNNGGTIRRNSCNFFPAQYRYSGSSCSSKTEIGEKYQCNKAIVENKDDCPNWSGQQQVDGHYLKTNATLGTVFPVMLPTSLGVGLLVPGVIIFVLSFCCCCCVWYRFWYKSS